jgi:hypothetical protein
MNRLPANQKHQPHGKRRQRYEKPQPGHRLQVDVKFLELKCHQGPGTLHSPIPALRLSLGSRWRPVTVPTLLADFSALLEQSGRKLSFDPAARAQAG